MFIQLHVNLRVRLFVCICHFHRTWNVATQSTAIEVIEHHTEFVYGIDFNLHIPGQVLLTSDTNVYNTDLF